MAWEGPIGHSAAMAEPDARATNAPEITVSELSSVLKRAIEDRFGYVRVRGEISGYRGPHSSGHAYFSLKDANARLDAVIWRTAFQRLRVKPEEGLEVVATGKLTTFPGKSSYQIVIEALELAGLGALMALLEARRRKLAAEGLFDAARKRKIPFLPKVVGVVTSPTAPSFATFCTNSQTDSRFGSSSGRCACRERPRRPRSQRRSTASMPCRRTGWRRGRTS